MHFKLINNPDESQGPVYQIARVIFAETGASSLAAVEALASMISNRCTALNQSPYAIAGDTEIFESLKPSSCRHALLTQDVSTRGFQMCLRVVNRMLRGRLPDACNGAIRFHRCDKMPEWAIARGYIADVDGMLFYL